MVLFHAYTGQKSVRLFLSRNGLSGILVQRLGMNKLTACDYFVMAAMDSLYRGWDYETATADLIEWI